VEQMLKMLMAYMLMHYDIEYLPSRPANFVLGPINVPPPGATIKEGAGWKVPKKAEVPVRASHGRDFSSATGG
jgi:hypothetical protein